MANKFSRKTTGTGISIRNIQVVVAILTLLISAALLVVTYKLSGEYDTMLHDSEEYIRLEESSKRLMEASDYLTDEARFFVQTGKIEHLENYVEEVNETKRREKAVEALEEISTENNAFKALEHAMKNSKTLSVREYYAMRLTAEVYGYDISELPEEIQDVKLRKADKALSKDEKDKLARSLMFDATYIDLKSNIIDNMNLCLDELSSSLSKNTRSDQEAFAVLLDIQRVLVIIAISAILISMLITILLLISPLLRAVAYIHADEPIPVKGSNEFKFLARTYNIMYEANREQKEQLAYDATHDYLTGLYNRSGYDFYLHNIQLDDSALILLEADKFKKVNDGYGHDIGDKILIKIANAITDSYRSQDYICRLGGDEFAVLPVHVSESSLAAVAAKVDNINKKLADTSDGLPYIQISAGVAHGKGLDTEQLFKKADKALYSVKQSGGAAYKIAE